MVKILVFVLIEQSAIILVFIMKIAPHGMPMNESALCRSHQHVSKTYQAAEIHVSINITSYNTSKIFTVQCSSAAASTTMAIKSIDIQVSSVTLSTSLWHKNYFVCAVCYHSIWCY